MGKCKDDWTLLDEVSEQFPFIKECHGILTLKPQNVDKKVLEEFKANWNNLINKCTQK